MALTERLRKRHSSTPDSSVSVLRFKVEISDQVETLGVGGARRKLSLNPIVIRKEKHRNKHKGQGRVLCAQK